MRFDTSMRRNAKNDLDSFANFLNVTTQKQQKNDTCSPVLQNNGRKSLAMVYPEKQIWQRIYDPEIALVNGTIFEELNLLFKKSSCRGNNFGEGCIL